MPLDYVLVVVRDLPSVVDLENQKVAFKDSVDE